MPGWPSYPGPHLTTDDAPESPYHPSLAEPYTDRDTSASVHIGKAGDTRDHVTDGSPCWCGARVEQVPAAEPHTSTCDGGPNHPGPCHPAPPTPRPSYFPTFADLAHDLVRYRRAAGDPEITTMLDNIRFAFDDLIDRVSIDMPDGPDATLATRDIHRACQSVIFAVVRAHVP